MRQYLQYSFLHKTFSKPASLLNQRHIQELLKQSGQSVQDVFRARYSQFFLGNVSIPIVFAEVVSMLQKMIWENERQSNKGPLKKKPTIKNQSSIEMFLDLMFTQSQKSVISQELLQKFGIQPIQKLEGQEQKEEQNIEILSYIFKKIFMQKSLKNQIQQQQQSKRHIFENTNDDFDFDI